MLKNAFATVLMGLALGAPVLAADADHVQVENPYVRAMPPTAPTSAAFMTLKNTGDATALVKAESPVANKVELHTHVHDNGVMRMRPIRQIDLPAHGEVTLKPGGLHIMLIGLKQPLKAGEQVSVTLVFKDGSRKTVTAPVKMIHAGMGHMHHMVH